MKYTELKQQKEESIEKLIKDCNVFFAFSKEQFNENKTPLKDGEKYKSIGAGGYIPASKSTDFVFGLERIQKNFFSDIVNLNLSDDAIRYELSNHECFLTWDIKPAQQFFHGVFTYEQIKAVFDTHKNEYANL